MKVTKSVLFSEGEVNELKNKAVLEEAAKVLGPCGEGQVYEVVQYYRDMTVSIKDKENATE